MQEVCYEQKNDDVCLAWLKADEMHVMYVCNLK